MHTYLRLYIPFIFLYHPFSLFWFLCLQRVAMTVVVTGAVWCLIRAAHKIIDITVLNVLCLSLFSVYSFSKLYFIVHLITDPGVWVATDVRHTSVNVNASKIKSEQLKTGGMLGFTLIISSLAKYGKICTVSLLLFEKDLN